MSQQTELEFKVSLKEAARDCAVAKRAVKEHEELGKDARMQMDTHKDRLLVLELDHAGFKNFLDLPKRLTYNIGTVHGFPMELQLRGVDGKAKSTYYSVENQAKVDSLREQIKVLQAEIDAIPIITKAEDKVRTWQVWLEPATPKDEYKDLF